MLDIPLVGAMTKLRISIFFTTVFGWIGGALPVQASNNLATTCLESILSKEAPLLLSEAPKWSVPAEWIRNSIHPISLKHILVEGTQHLDRIAEFIRNSDTRTALAYLKSSSEWAPIPLTFEKIRSMQTIAPVEIDSLSGSPITDEELALGYPAFYRDAFGAAVTFEGPILFVDVSFAEVRIQLGPIAYSVWDSRFDGIRQVEAWREAQVVTLFEETAHLLQYIRAALNYSPYLSLKGSKLDAVLHYGRRLSEEHRKNQLVPVNWDLEADVYAYMLEKLGDKVPKFYGYASPYPTRALVDLWWRNHQWDDAELANCFRRSGNSVRPYP